LSHDLRQLGRGFGRRNLFQFRQFYLRYPIVQSVIAQFCITLPHASSVSFQPLQWQDDSYFARIFHEIPWTNFIELIRIDDPLKRAFYENETHVEYALGGLNNKIFVSRYLLHLPSEKELQAFIQRTRRKFER